MTDEQLKLVIAERAEILDRAEKMLDEAKLYDDRKLQLYTSLVQVLMLNQVDPTQTPDDVQERYKNWRLRNGIGLRT